MRVQTAGWRAGWLAGGLESRRTQSVIKTVVWRVALPAHGLSQTGVGDAAFITLRYASKNDMLQLG